MVSGSKRKSERRLYTNSLLSMIDMRQQYDNGFDPFDPEQQSGGNGGFHQQGNPFAHFQGFPFGGGGGFPGSHGNFEFKMHF